MALLEDVLVLDLTRAVAGPFCTMMLGDLGARVIKIEEEGAGDETRQWGPPFVDGWSTYFLSMNRNKESVAVNLKSAEGLRLVEKIAARADVVIENFRPGVAERLGLGYETLSAANPRLIYASVSGFGQTGPDRERPGYDLILQAVSGCMHVSASEEQGAVKVAFPVADILAGLFAEQAILAALYRRQKSGEGRRIEVSLLDGMLCAMSNLATGTLLTGREPRRVGTAQPNIVPYQLFPCADAPIVVGAPNDRLWEKFCQALGHPEWIADERFQGNRRRNENRPALVSLIENILKEQRAAHWLERLEAQGVPCGPVMTMAQALAHRQVAERGTIVETDHATLGRIRLIGHPARIGGHEVTYRAPVDLGADTEAVKREFL